MIAGEERRNVAANTRSAAERAEDDLDDDSNCSRLAAPHAAPRSARGVPRHKDLLRLAGPIDPPTTPCICEKCGGECPSGIMSKRCPRCGEEINR